MDKLKAEIEKTSEMKKQLCGWAETEIAKGMNAANTEELGLCIDMIKDLACMEKDLAECCYYKKIVEAMDESKKEEEMYGRMGYNTNRYASGRYAPSGHGNYTRGFHPSGHEYGMEDMMPMDMMEMGIMSDMYGYSDAGRSMNPNGRGRVGYSPHQTEDHIEMVMNQYRTAGTEQQRREVKEKLERALSEMR